MRQKRTDTHTTEETAAPAERAVLVGIDRGDKLWPVDESLAELERLAHTAGIEVVATATQRMDRPHPRSFIGSGKVDEVAALAASTSATMVIFDDELSPSQQMNLSGQLADVQVKDRTLLILDIFADHAVSREGKLQVDLARLEYLLPRLRGLWGHLEKERLGGGRGTRFGAGESQLETDRRLARRRISELKRELAAVSEERSLQRKGRARSGVFRVSLVGYTNAGKSTLLNALTGADVLAYDMLFATLDSTTRALTLPEGRQVTITDTVGFINKLPHGLVEAFKSTLDEVAEADALIHVVDAGAGQRDAQMQAVREVLQEIGAHTTSSFVVFNKADTIDAQERATLAAKYPDAIICTAITGEGVAAVIERIAAEAARGTTTVSAMVPYDRGDLVRLAHERTQIVSERHTDEGTALTMRVPAEFTSKFAPYAVEGEQS